MDWGEPISVYTDEQAVDDGVLVDVHAMQVQHQGAPINRMTRHLWEDFQPFLTPYTENGMTVMAALAKIIKTKLAYAVGDPGNTGECGDIVKLPPKLWLVRNELDGWTIMYPEDY